MAFVGGADEVIIFNVHQLPQVLGVGDDLIHISLGGDALFSSLALDLLAVLIRAGQEIGVITRHLLKTGHGVRRHRGVGVADVHVAGGIVNRRGNVILLLLHLVSTFLSELKEKPLPLSKRGGLQPAVPPLVYRFTILETIAGLYRDLPFSPTYRAERLPGHVPLVPCAAFHQPRLSLAGRRKGTLPFIVTDIISDYTCFFLLVNFQNSIPASHVLTKAASSAQGTA